MTVALVAAIVSVATSVAGAISGSDVDGAIAAANNRSSATAASTQNSSRAFSNLNIEAQNNLTRFTQAANNNKKLAAGGVSLGANVQNYLQQKDALLNSGFESGIAQAQTMGSNAASAAFAGVTGSVVDNINSATILKNDRIDGQTQEASKSLDQNYSDKQTAIVGSTISGLDNKTVFDNVDNSINVALTQASPTWFGKFLGMGGAQATVGAGQQFFSTSGKNSTTNGGFGNSSNNPDYGHEGMSGAGSNNSFFNSPSDGVGSASDLDTMF